MTNKNSASEPSVPEKTKGEISPVTGGSKGGIDSEHASVEDIVLFVKQLCLTYSKLSLYSSSHPVVVAQIKSAWDELLPVFRKYGNISISLTEGKLLFFGMPVEERNPTVSKFAQHFENLHIHSVEFAKDLSFEEFSAFIVLFSQEARVIIDQGGLDKLLHEKEIKNISFNTAVYQVIGRDQKVVNKADLYMGKAETEEDEKSSVLRYFLGELLSEMGNEEQFLEEIKNDPKKFAERIIKIFEHIGTDQDIDKDSIVDALISNITRVAESITPTEGGTGDAKQTVADAMITLEAELKRKSRALSPGASIHFIKKITDVVSSYSDRAKAERVLGEFLRHEKSLKSAESMLKEVTTETAGGDRILQNIKRIMKEKGYEADELVQYLEKNVKEKKVRKTVKKKPVRPLTERIKDKLDSEFKDIKEKDKLISYLDNVYNKEMQGIIVSKTQKLQKEIVNAQDTIRRIKDILNETNIGMIILDEEQKVRFAEHIDKLLGETEVGEFIPEGILGKIKTFNSGEKLHIGDVTVLEVLKSKEGKIKSVLFQF